MTAAARVLVVTVVHHPEDARIRHRQIGALLGAGLAVTYAAPFRAHGLPLPRVAGLRPVDLPHASGRDRWEAFRAARQLVRVEADLHDIVLIHDPELLAAVAGLGLRNVVWDVHEDTPAAIEAKGWIPAPGRRPAARLVRARERHAERRHDLLLAEYGYAERFRDCHFVAPNTVRVPAVTHPPGDRRAAYLGSVTMARGAATLVEAGRLARDRSDGAVSVHVIGPTRDEATRQCLDGGVARGEVSHAGFLPNDEALRALDGSLAGLSLLQDRPNYRHSMPTKVIEYMARGLPVITTPLPLARDLVSLSGCGVTVPFDDPAAVADALLALHRDPDRRLEMGAAGHRYVREHFDWNVIGHDFVRHLTGVASTRPAWTARTAAL